MEALILSCSTGGGHNSAAHAMVHELTARGWTVHFFDPYSLRSPQMARRVGNAYVSMVQLSPHLFGAVYQIGRLYEEGERNFSLPNPVLAVQKKTALALHRWLSEHPVDLILCSHPYPGLMLTWLKNHGLHVPPSVMIPTDYTCIPFESDVQTDWMTIPHPDLVETFFQEGVDHSRMIPCGIPVDRKFDLRTSRDKACKALGLSPSRRYVLVGGGSMGIKGLWPMLISLQPLLEDQPDLHILVLCGNNRKLYRRIEKFNDPSISPVAFTKNIFQYLQLADLFITKPGGLSITEAAASGTPLLLAFAIPGCETQNAEFFERHGYACYARTNDEIASLAAHMLKHRRPENTPPDPFFTGISRRLGDWCELAASMNPQSDPFLPGLAE